MLHVLSINKGQAQVRPLIICVTTGIDPTELYASRSAGQLSPVTVTTENPSCTNYIVSENYTWISYSKNGHTVTITVTANTGPARTGNVNIGGYTLTVNQACGNYPTAPTSASSNRNNFCADAGGNISLSATGGSGTTIRWFTGSCGGNSIGTGTPLSIPAPTSTTTYYARWENNCSVSSCASVTVQVYSISGGQIGYDQSIVFFDDPSALVSLSPASGGLGTFNYQWKQSNNGGQSWSDITGATSTGYDPPNLSSITKYTRSATDNGGCGTVASNIVTVDFQKSPDTTMNFIYTVTPNQAVEDINSITSNDSISFKIQYFDGLGRPLQNVHINGSPDKNDIITPFYYDEFGRESIKFIPFTEPANGGSYVGAALNAQRTFYGSLYFPGDTANAKTIFESSPISRILEQGSPGIPWQPQSGHTIRFNYLSNADYEVLLWKVNGDTLVNTGGSSHNSFNYFPENTLFKTITKDENWNQTDTLHNIEEFKDFNGKIILKRSFVNNSTSIDTLDTYYVYDNYGLLRYVLSPKAVESITGSMNYILSSDDIIKNLCYYYKYDKRHRISEKQMPGADPTYIVYDNRDRVVLTQDGNLRRDANNNELKKWLFTKYDMLNRPVLTGIFTYESEESQEDMQAIVDNVYSPTNPRSYFVERNSSLTSTLGFTDTSFPNASDDNSLLYLTATYFDSYDFPDSISFDNSTDISNYSDTQGNYNYFDNMIDKVTGTKAIVLETSTYITTTNYSDDKYRVIQSLKNLLDDNNGVEIISNRYDFVGHILRTKQKQTFDNSTTSTDKYYTYDHIGRLKKTESSINGGNATTVAEMTYNELGQLSKKELNKTGSSSLQEVNYEYNIRGWLTGINDPGNLGTDLFSMELLYEDPSSLTNLTKENQYNGNISGIIWNRKTDPSTSLKSAYTLEYDELNRILNNYYGEGSTLPSSNHFREYDYSYDLNGNILTLKRNNGSGTTIDNLSYNYGNSPDNRLKYITDNSASSVGFNDGNTSGDDYAYDKNGNLIEDLNKGFGIITYNFLNLPYVLTKDANNIITYYYDAQGTKVKQVKTEGGTPTVRYYSNGFEYDNNKDLNLVQMEEGSIKVSNNATVFKYEYFIKDHLGSTRIAFENNSGTPSLTQSVDYYPFGLEFDSKYEISTDNKYLYNGKELQEQLNLDWYDYGARFYDPQIGRWTTQDPRAEKYRRWSPYNYCFNNPIKYLDPYGDTITLSNAFKNNKEWMQAYDTWSQTKVGQRFTKNYGVGGKNESVSVVFDIGEKVQGASATTGAYTVDKGSGKETRIEPNTEVDNSNGIVGGTDKDSYLREHLHFFPGGTTSLAEGAETINHETQHVRIDRQTLITNKMVAPSWLQHDWMSPRNSGWYQDRYEMFQSLRQHWQSDYHLQLINGKVKNEQEYINNKINDFAR